MGIEWCKTNYEKSVTSHAWGATPYDAGWDGSAKYGEDLPASAELRAIFDEEMALGAVPDWAIEIIRRMIGPLPMCGHSHKTWYDAFLASLTAWLDGDRNARAELGEPTPVKHWLVRLLRHKLRLYEEHDPFGNLVGAKSSGKRGTRTV